MIGFGYRLLRLLDAILQVLVPPKRHCWCFASVPDYCDNAFYLYLQAIRGCKEGECVWLLHDMKLAARVRQEFAEQHRSGVKLTIRRWGSAAGYWAFLRSRVVFHTHGLYFFSNRAFRRFRVGLWHGMPIKCIGRLNHVSPNPRPTFGTHFIASSHLFRYVMACAFGVPAERVLVSGQPRCDALVNAPCRLRQPSEVLSALHIEGGQRLVLWLPTYRAEGEALQANGRKRNFTDELDASLLHQLNLAALGAKCKILIKLHPAEQADVQQVFASYTNIQIMTAAEWEHLGVQLYDVLAASHGLISDVSSVLIDFMMTGRPIGVLGFDPSRYTRDLVFPVELIASSQSISVLSSIDDVDQFIAAVAGEEPSRAAPNDLAWALNENHAGDASQSLLEAFGVMSVSRSEQA